MVAIWVLSPSSASSTDPKIIASVFTIDSFAVLSNALMAQTDQLLSSFDKSWDEFSGAWKKARSKASEKSIHDLRVGTRRLIARLELTRALSRNAEIADVQRRFKKILKRMGPLPEVQVQLESLSHMRQ